MANNTMNVRGDLGFYKIYMDDENYEKLKIPVAFVERVDGYLRVNSVLEGPSGEEWKVVLENTDSGVYFTKGWAEFVEGNDLELLDFMTFTCDGVSRFKVKIFGGDCCIKRCHASMPRINSFRVVIPQTSRRNCSFNLPAKFGNRFLKTGQQRFEATLRTYRDSWPVTICTSSGRLRFRTGWIKFYDDNGLRAGDICHFQLIDEAKFVLDVRIQKRM